MSTNNQSKTTTRAAAGAGIVFSAQIVGYGLYFFAQRIILSSMTKEAFGSLAYIQLMCSIVLVVLVDAGMNNVALREMIRQPEKKREIIAGVFWLRMMGTVLSCLVVCTIFLLTTNESLTLVTLAVVMIVFNGRSAMMRGAIELPFRESMRFSMVSLTFVADILLYVLLLIIFRSHLSPFTIFSLQLLSSLPGFVFIAWRVKILRLIFPIPSKQQLLSLIRDVRPLTAQLLSQNIHAAIDLFVLKLYAPIRELGVLGAVGNMGSIIITAYAALSVALYPMVSEAIHSGRGNAEYRIERTLSFVTFVSVLLATTLCVLSPFIADVFTKNVYADNIFQFHMQFWCAVAINISQTALIINSAQNQHRAMFLSGIFLLVGSITADFILIPQFYCAGFLGAKMWSNGLSAAISLYYIGKAFSHKMILVYVLRTTALLAISVPFSMMSSAYISMPVGVVVGVLAVGATAWVLGFITKDEIELTRKLVMKLRQRLSTPNNAQV